MRRSTLKRMPSPAVLIALAALVLAAGGAAVAAIPDSQGTIHACFQQRNGNLRVVQSSAACRPDENPLSWNQGSAGAVNTLRQVVVPGNQQRVLFTRGPFSFTGVCVLDSATESGSTTVTDVALIMLSTTQNHSALSSGGGGRPSADLSPGADDPADRDSPRRVIRAFDEVGQPSFNSTQFSASAPEGTSLGGVLYAGVNVLGHRRECVFGGHYVVS